MIVLFLKLQTSGKPTFTILDYMRGQRNTDKNIRKYITINDMNLWEYIDKIMELDEYKNSFNKVINKALYYGLPIFYNSLFKSYDNTSLEENEKNINEINEELLNSIIKLLKEIILNATINKSILCSLFEIKGLELEGYQIDSKKYRNGVFRDTPDYLLNYEAKVLRDIRK